MPDADAALRYLAYGSRIESEFTLWPADSERGGTEAADIAVAWARPDTMRGEAFFGDRDCQLSWPGLARITVQGGKRIEVSAAPDAEQRELVAALTGPALAAALTQRGFLVLHGACVVIDGAAVCLLGPSGAGKSTLAAALCSAGGALVSDAMTVIALRDDGPMVQPGPPQVKLWPDAARANGYQPESLPRVLPGSTKRICRHVGTMLRQEVRLSRVFLVSESAEVALAELRPASASVVILQNHFLAGYFDIAQQQRWLPVCGELAQQVSVAALARGSALADVPRTLGLLRRSSR